jgi:hypothetical protein
MHDHSFNWLEIGTLLKSGALKPVLRAQTWEMLQPENCNRQHSSQLNEWSCIYLLGVSILPLSSDFSIGFWNSSIFVIFILFPICLFYSTLVLFSLWEYDFSTVLAFCHHLLIIKFKYQGTSHDITTGLHLYHMLSS